MELKGFTKLLLSATLLGASGQAAAQKEISFVVTNQERQTVLVPAMRGVCGR